MRNLLIASAGMLVVSVASANALPNVVPYQVSQNFSVASCTSTMPDACQKSGLFPLNNSTTLSYFVDNRQLVFSDFVLPFAGQVPDFFTQCSAVNPLTLQPGNPISANLCSFGIGNFRYDMLTGARNAYGVITLNDTIEIHSNGMTLDANLTHAVLTVK